MYVLIIIIVTFSELLCDRWVINLLREYRGLVLTELSVNLSILQIHFTVVGICFVKTINIVRNYKIVSTVTFSKNPIGILF